MTLRPFAARARRRRAGLTAIVLAAGGLAVLAGCDPRQAMYFLQPFEQKINAPCPSLKGKKVVVLTSAVAGLQTDNVGIDQEIAKRLVEVLRANVKKIDVVDPAEVADWARAKATWSDPVEAVRAFDADVVIFLELREFQIQSPSSPGLFEGRSNIHIQVTELAHPKDHRGKPITDRPKEAKVIYDGDRTTAFPVTGHIPAEASVNASIFRNRFLEVVVKELSWHFVEHAMGDNIQNTRFD
jgi:hypothetical protein